MKKKLIALLLALCLILSGCESMYEFFGVKGGYTFSEFTYVRPDIADFEKSLEKCQRTLRKPLAINDIVGCINQFYDLYDAFYTQMNLADLRYYRNITDESWAAESEYCAQMAPQVEAKLEELYISLAKSSYKEVLEGEDYFGEGFLESYLQEKQTWDEEYIALSEQEVTLQQAYQKLYGKTTEFPEDPKGFYDTYGEEMAGILVKLISVRQQMAAKLGFNNYVDMTYYGYYDRDYTPGEAKTYLQNLGSALGPIFSAVSEDPLWEYMEEPATEAEVFSYVENTAKAMGGDVLQAFLKMQVRELYDITVDANKYNGSYTVYLSSYGVPYIFVCPYGLALDRLTFAHEFGHFVNDYLCKGSWVGTDVAEVQSQGMEFMSLLYADDPRITQYKMADSLSVFVEQSAYALFEQEVYSLTGEDLTEENIRALYVQICEDFYVAQEGFHPYEFVTLNHIYEQPLYLISYVVSNDLALQFYELETGEGKGLEKYLAGLESEDYYIREFALEYGLTDPFDKNRPRQLQEFFETMFPKAQDQAA